MEDSLLFIGIGLGLVLLVAYLTHLHHKTRQDSAKNKKNRK
jgi:hypothetical protein